MAADRDERIMKEIDRLELESLRDISLVRSNSTAEDSGACVRLARLAREQAIRANNLQSWVDGDEYRGAVVKLAHAQRCGCHDAATLNDDDLAAMTKGWVCIGAHNHPFVDAKCQEVRASLRGSGDR